MGWKERGPLLAVLLLPLAALAFRRNWLLSLVLLSGVLAPPRPAMASTWDDLWQRPDQQAARAFAQKDYASAAALATDARRRGSAEYKRGNFQAALDDFRQVKGPDANYNRGNALARLNRFEDAVAAYDQALKEHPGDADAQANKAAVEAMLKQQQQAANAQDKKSQDRQKPDQGKNSGKAPAKGSGEDQGKEQGKEQGKDQGPSGSGSQADASSGTAPGKGAQPGVKQGQDSTSASTGKANPDTTGNPASGANQRGDNGKPANSPAAKNPFADAAAKLAAQPAQASNDAGTASVQGAGAAKKTTSDAGKPAEAGARADAQPMSSEEQLAADQWLRRIPDDPGGLLRRKFLYQYRQRAQRSGSDGG